MPRALTCRVGVFRSTLAVPGPLRLGNVPLERYLERASASGGVEGLSLTFDLSRQTASVLSAGTPTQAFWLQVALKRLTGNGAAGPVERVGLVFADRWRRPGVLGMMFDLGFNPDDLQPVNAKYLAMPREGCAVFLDAIADLRDNDVDRRTEALFTSVHELGHVFNLWHRQVPFRFMSSSLKDRVAQPPFAFDDLHRKYLTHVDDDHVWPGGTKFGDRGDLGPSDRRFDNSFDLARSRSALRLRVDLVQREFWRFEPIELDIEVAVPRGIKKSYRLPDTVDPGYDDFDVWIEEPGGERRRYRSPRHYCQNLGRLKLSATRPFARDLSVFAESGGYTFRGPGRDQVRATWRLPGGRTLESNRVEVNVKSRLERSEEYDALCKTLANPRVASLLYYRDGPYRGDVVETVEALARRTGDASLEASLSYTLGRFLYLAGKGRAASTRRRHHERALRHLGRALDSEGGLSPHRCRHAQEIEERIHAS